MFYLNPRVVPGGTSLFGNGLVTTPSISFVSEPTLGAYRPQAGIVDWAQGGVAGIRMNMINGLFTIPSSSFFSWSSTTSATGSTDLFLARDAASVLAQRDGVNAQAFRVYNTFTDATNYERLNSLWSGNVAFLQTENAGTGTARSLEIGTGGNSAFAIRTNGTQRWFIGGGNGTWQASTDNVSDIGATGAARPRSMYLGTLLQIEANNGLKLTNQVNGAAAQAGTLLNAPAAGNPTFWVPVTINGVNGHIPFW